MEAWEKFRRDTGAAAAEAAAADDAGVSPNANRRKAWGAPRQQQGCFACGQPGH